MFPLEELHQYLWMLIDTFNIDTTKLEKAIKKVLDEGKLTPKVIIPVDLFGLPADHIENRENC